MGYEDIGATRRFIVYSGKERFQVAKNVTAIPLIQMMNEICELNKKEEIPIIDKK